MSRMVRKQVYIEAEQEKFLKRRARQLGVTEAELVRQGIDQIARPGAWLPPDPKAWEEAKSVIRDRMRLRVPQTSRAWTREQLYDRWEQRHPD